MSTPSREPQLRASYVWSGEVMGDRVLATPEPITIGSAPRATFVTAPLGLPESFSILRPGRAGYVLTVSTQMGGTLNIGGQTDEVADFARGADGSASASGSFRATAVGPGDWGVIHLDGHGEHTFFFQFVDPTPPLPKAVWRNAELLLPAVAFSVFMHAILLTYIFYIDDRPDRYFGFHNANDLVANYMINRPEPEAPEAEPKAGAEDGDKDAKPAATVGKAGKKGGEGDKPRKRAPNPDQGNPDEELAPRRTSIALTSSAAQAEIAKLRQRGGFDRRLGDATARFQGKNNNGGLAGFGPGKGTGINSGKGTGTTRNGGMGGPGGGGSAHADAETRANINTGSNRQARGLPTGTGVKEAKVSVKTGSASGKLGGLTAAQIRKVVLSRRNAILTCYDRQLQRQKGLSGKVVIRWKITSTGSVSGAKVASSTLRNGATEDCIIRQFARMKFPAPGGGEIPVVKFPFIFNAR